MPYAPPLTERDADEALRRLPEWTRDGNWISRTVELPTFRLAIGLVDAVADAAEDANHHPNFEIRWRRVTFRLTTHSAKALTARDMDLAARIDALVAAALGLESPGR